MEIYISTTGIIIIILIILLFTAIVWHYGYTEGIKHSNNHNRF